MTKLPKRNKSQRIGESAAELLNSVLTEFCNVIPIPQSRDLGIDFICEIMEGEHPTGRNQRQSYPTIFCHQASKG